MEEWTRQRDSVPAPRVTESPKLEPAFRKRFSESFRFNPSPLRRHSLAHSICSSVSSAHFFDSDTTYSASTVASPISTVYESETEDHVCPHFLDRPSSRAVERSRQHFASFDSGSTWVGDRDEEDKISHDELALANQMSPVTPENKSDDEDLDSPDTAQHMIDDDVSMLGSSESGVNEQADAASPRTLICDASSVTTDEAPESDADTLLSYTLQLVYGIDAQDQEPHIRHLRRLTARYIREVGDSIWHSPAADGEQPHSQGNSYSSSTPSPTENGRRGSQSGHSQSSSKRKPDDGTGDGSQGSGQGSGLVPVKKARQGIRDEGNLRLSCPFRKRNPSRFNVRDHHSCAMTYFPKFAELRQHIVKQHKRDDPSAFVCDRCNRDFCSRRELREHQRLPKELMCDLADHDPESGIDGPTCNKLLSRKRASGTSPFVQWREIWNLIFPDDDDHAIGTFNFIPVIEHFELASKFHASVDLLRASLQDRIPDQAMLDAVCAEFERCFAETVEQCLTAAQELHYVNRSNKKAELSRGTAQQQQQQVARGGSQHVPGIVPRPDSGVVLDDGSEESGSVTSSGVRYNNNGTFRVLSCPDQPAAFVFGDGGLDTPALSLQTPTSAFNPDMPPAATQLMPLGGSVNSGPQTDFTRLWADEMLYNMTTVDAGNSDVAEQGRWESTPSHMALHESMTPNLF